MKLIDTHCHLVSEKLRDSLSDYVERAAAAGVHKIIDIAYDPESVHIALEQLERHSCLYAAVGIQPHDAHTFNSDEAQKIRLIARSHPRVVAIGEIGLDDYHKLAPMQQQIDCFETFLQIALDERLPIVVHVRETHEAVASRLRPFTQKGGTGVIHCFTGSLPEAREFLDMGLYISFSGIVTFKNALELKEVAKFVPSDRILIETDSPYLAPVPHRGKTNEPSFVRNVCELVAELRGVTPEILATQTTHNAEHLFYRMKDPL